MDSIPHDALVVVADGTGARVFRNRGHDRDLMLHQFDLMELMNMDDDGPSGSMPDGSDDHRIDKATFAKQLARSLNEGALRQQYEDLVIVADEKTLGEVRGLLHKEARDRLRGAIAKNLTNSPLDDIQRILVPQRT